ncbi:phospholipase D-like domain-containing protein [Paludibacterium paludis]|nr:phospholipase D-like domain-containing protein [Paludibacterium paludis]
MPPQTRHSPLARQLADQVFSRSAGAPLVGGNAIRLLFDSKENFPAWLDSIRNARHSILMEMYLVGSDSFGRELCQALAERARAGVRVVLVYDWLGSWVAQCRGVFAELAAAGGQVVRYNPPSTGNLLGLFGRDHRKLIVVDSEVAYISGLCASARWEGANGTEPWRDTGLALRGPLVGEAINAIADTLLHCGHPLREETLEELHRRVPESAGNVAARLIATTPATAHMMRLDLLVAGFARHTLWLTDAYFVGTSLYMMALKEAARDGVDVRLLVPRASDIPWIAALSRTLYRPLLEAGVRVFEWNGPMIHAKTAMADRRWARIGSTNLNISSWLANRELDVAIEDEGIAAQMADRFLADLDNATEIVLGARRIPVLTHPRPVTPGSRRTPSAAAAATAAARQAARIGDVMGAAVRGTRAVEGGEAGAFMTIGAILLGLALAILAFPKLLAYPLAIVLLFSGGAILLRAVTLRLDGLAERKKQHPARRPDTTDRTDTH